MATSEPVLAVKGLDAYYGQSHVLQGVEFEMGADPVAIIGRNGMGKTTLCKVILGLVPPRATGLGRVRRHGARREVVAPDRPRGASATCRRAGGSSRPLSVDEHLRMMQVERRRPLDGRLDLRAVPAAGRAAQKRRHAALGRRAADARDRPGAAHEPEAAGHGRALRGARADDRRGPRRDVEDARRRGHEPPADRAESRRRDRGRRAPARHGGGQHLHRDDRAGAADRPRPAALPRCHPHRARQRVHRA